MSATSKKLEIIQQVHSHALRLIIEPLLLGRGSVAQRRRAACPQPCRMGLIGSETNYDRRKTKAWRDHATRKQISTQKSGSWRAGAASGPGAQPDKSRSIALGSFDAGESEHGRGRAGQQTGVDRLGSSDSEPVISTRGTGTKELRKGTSA